MPEKKSEQIKLVIVSVLALVLVIVVGARYKRQKGPEAVREVASPAFAASLEVPEVTFEKRAKTGWRTSPVGPPDREPLRDILAPGASPAGQAAALSGEEESVSIASLKLRGVVAGGPRPVALINDRFVRLGDRLYQYQVASIGAKEVWLASGMETFQLRILKDE